MTTSRFTLNIAKHGGCCCGIHHIYGFPDVGLSSTEKIQGINEVVTRAVEDDDWPHAVEAVLADYQISEWRRALNAVGFKQAFKFVNGNSGNRCFVFYLDTGKIKE